VKKHFEDLLAWCKSKGIKVTFTDSKRLSDYGAMQPTVAKKLGFKDIKENEILIDVELPEDTQFKNLIHELIEKELMDDGESYWESHKKSIKAEKWALKKAQKFVNKRKGKAPLRSATIRISRSK
jgi:hypothetical protein